MGGPTSNWRRIGALPKHTEAVVEASGALTALAISGSDETAWQRSPGGRWTRGQRLRVPIEYGSST